MDQLQVHSFRLCRQAFNPTGFLCNCCWLTTLLPGMLTKLIENLLNSPQILNELWTQTCCPLAHWKCYVLSLKQVKTSVCNTARTWLGNAKALWLMLSFWPKLRDTCKAQGMWLKALDIYQGFQRIKDWILKYQQNNKYEWIKTNSIGCNRHISALICLAFLSCIVFTQRSTSAIWLGPRAYWYCIDRSWDLNLSKLIRSLIQLMRCSKPLDMVFLNVSDR